jgi:hypothetical protein
MCGANRFHHVVHLHTSRAQKKMGSFVIAMKKPSPVTKQGLKEFLLELVVDGDLVNPSYSFSFIPSSFIYQLVLPFR